jgi:hypothetical protein
VIVAKKPELDPSVNSANRVEKARQFYDEATNSERPKPERNSSWGQLWLLKQKAKYSWENLGFNAKEAERIKLNRPDWV